MGNALLATAQAAAPHNSLLMQNPLGFLFPALHMLGTTKQSGHTLGACRCTHAPVSRQVLLNNTRPACANKHNVQCLCLLAVCTASPAGWGMGMAHACMAWLRTSSVHQSASILDKHDTQLPQHAAGACRKRLQSVPHHQDLNILSYMTYYPRNSPKACSELNNEAIHGFLSTVRQQHQAVSQSQVWLRQPVPICLRPCNSAKQSPAPLLAAY